EEQLLPNPGHHVIHAFASLEVGKHEGLLTAHHFRITVHDLEVCPNIRGKIRLVDHEKIGSRDARTSLARNLVASRDVDDVDRRVHQFRAKTRGEIVATALEKQN